MITRDTNGVKDYMKGTDEAHYLVALIATGNTILKAVNKITSGSFTKNKKSIAFDIVDADGIAIFFWGWKNDVLSTR